MYEELLRLVWEDPERVLSSGEAFDLVDIYYHNPKKLKALKAVLSSDDEAVVRTGAFIAAELGEWGAPVLNECIDLIERGFDGPIAASAYSCVCSCIKIGRVWPVAYILEGLEREGFDFVCSLFVADLSEELVRVVGDYIEFNDLGAEHLVGFRAIARADSDGFKGVVVELAESRSRLLSYYALIVAMRYESYVTSRFYEQKGDDVLDGLELYRYLVGVVGFEDFVENVNGMLSIRYGRCS